MHRLDGPYNHGSWNDGEYWSYINFVVIPNSASVQYHAWKISLLSAVRAPEEDRQSEVEGKGGDAKGDGRSRKEKE